jgi:DNA-binding phage protein
MAKNSASFSGANNHDELPYFTVPNDPALKKKDSKASRAKGAGSDWTYFVDNLPNFQAHWDTNGGFDFGYAYSIENKFEHRKDTPEESYPPGATNARKATIDHRNSKISDVNSSYKDSRQAQWWCIIKCCSESFLSRVKATGLENDITQASVGGVYPQISSFSLWNKQWDHAKLIKRVGDICKAVNSSTVDATDPAYIEQRETDTSDAYNKLAQALDEDTAAYIARFKTTVAEFKEATKINKPEKQLVVKLTKSLKQPLYSEFIAQTDLTGYWPTLAEAEKKISTATLTAAAWTAHNRAVKGTPQTSVTYATTSSGSSGRNAQKSQKNKKQGQQNRKNNNGRSSNTQHGKPSRNKSEPENKKSGKATQQQKLQPCGCWEGITRHNIRFCKVLQKGMKESKVHVTSKGGVDVIDDDEDSEAEEDDEASASEEEVTKSRKRNLRRKSQNQRGNKKRKANERN